MAKGTVNFIVSVISKGLAKTKNEAEQLAASTNKVGDANARANKSAREHFNTQDKGIIGTANSTRSFSKLAQTVNGGGSSSVVGAYATLAANVFALTAAFNALRSAASMQQIEKGLEALGARTGQTLTVAARGLRDVTQEAISTEQAMRSAAQVFSAGFNGDQLERLGKVANDASFALGRNMTDSMDRLTRGVIKLEPELLDELGIMTRLGDATKTYAAELGKTDAQLTTTERRQAFYNAVMAEGELKFGGLAAQAGNTKAFDQLSASLSDLTKNTMNFLNIAALPLAKLFSSSPTALIGGALLFASTIKNQLLPGLSDLSKGASKNAEELSKQAKAQAAVIAGLQPANKSLQGLNSKIEDGTATLKHYQKGLEASGTALRKYTKELEQNYIVGDKQHKPLTDNQKSYRATEIEVLESYQSSLRKVINAEREAAAHTQSANAIEAAGAFKLTEAKAELINATRNYGTAMIANQKSQQTTATLMTRVRTAAFGASVGVRALGAAFLNAVPIIGQAIFVLGLAFAAFKALETQETKALNKATKNFLDIAKTLDDKLKDLERISKSTASIGSRTEQRIILETNAVMELAEAYRELQDAREAAANPKDREFNLIPAGLDKSINDMITGTKTSTEANKAFNLSTAERIFWISKQTAADRVMFDNLNKLTPEFRKQIEAVYGSLEKFSKLDRNTRTKFMEDFANSLDKNATSLSSAQKALTEAQKAAGTSMAEFLKSSIPTTPFDKVASDLKSYTKSIADFQVEVANGTTTTKDLQGLLMNMPEAVSGMMSLASASFIEDTNLVESVKQAGKDATAAQKILAAGAQRRLDISKVTVDTLRDELLVLQDQFQVAQRAAIVAQSENTLLNARLKASQENFSLTVTGLKRRMEIENKVIQNGVTALRQQKLIIQAQITQQNLRLAELKDRLKLIEIEKSQFLLLMQANKERARQRVLEAETRANSSYRNPEEFRKEQAELARLREEYSNYDKETKKYSDAYDAQIKAGTARIQALANENRSTQLGIQAINNEISAATMAQLSAAEQAVRLQERQAEIDRDRATKIRDMKSAVLDLYELEEHRASLVRDGAVTLRSEIATARQRYALNRENLIQEQAEGIRQLEIAKAKAAADTRDRASMLAATKHWDEEISIAKARESIEIERLDRTYELEQLQRAIFDKHREGLEWQQNGLTMLQRQVELQRELSESSITTAKAEEDLYRKRMGFGERTQSGIQAEEIMVARIAYESAVRESEIKKSLIDLEFALLEAQQFQLKEELRARQAVLAAANKDGALNPHLQQLQAVLDNMPRINFGAMREASKAVVDNTVQAARAELEAATTRSSGRINSAAEDYRKLVEERSAARSALQVQPIQTAALAIAENIEAAVDPVVLSQNTLTTSLDDLGDKVDALRTTLSPESPAAARTAEYTGRELAAAFGKYIQAEFSGTTAWQQPDLGNGNVGQHSRGSAHYEGRAVDIYSKAGNGEWTDAAERRRFERIKELAQEFGGRALFGPLDKHLTHLHASFKDGTQLSARAIEALGQYLPERIGAAVAEEVTKVSDVEVVGSRAGPREIMDPVKSLAPLSNIQVNIPEIYKTIDIAIDSMILLNDQASGLKAIFADLGPQGQVMISAIEGVSTFGATLDTAMNVFKKTDDPSKRFVAMADVAASALSTIQSMSRASADAKIAAIDAEIAAEQKRDGKSADSIAKLESLERKKDAINRKAFDTNKKLMMAQSIIATATGVAQSLTLGPIIGPIMAAMIGALGAAQLAIISGTSYQSTSAPAQQAAMPTTLSVGKRGDTVDLARNNVNAGGEIGYLRGARGQGRSAADYTVIGSAYGGELPRGYGNTGYLVGENGPEIIKPEVPVSVQPANDNKQGNPVNATFNINALDASGVQDILHAQRGFIIGSLREAANANGQTFLEDVNTNVYTKPNVGRL